MRTEQVEISTAYSSDEKAAEAWNRRAEPVDEKKSLQRTVECGDAYWFVHSGGYADTKRDERERIDALQFNCGNYYYTREHALAAAERVRMAYREVESNGTNVCDAD